MNCAIIITSPTDAGVRLCADAECAALHTLLARYGLTLHRVNASDTIPGSFWQAPEAGLVADKLYVRSDTPIHSALHEACHYICMDTARRQQLDTNAGGGYEEEDAVCYLQILLSEHITGMTRAQMFADMDAWGYSFRLGSARAWFEGDAEDARDWLLRHHLIDAQDCPNFLLRMR
jgi:hypothetical protein